VLTNTQAEWYKIYRLIFHTSLHTEGRIV
jgi:hypothetical protein